MKTRRVFVGRIGNSPYVLRPYCQKPDIFDTIITSEIG